MRKLMIFVLGIFLVGCKHSEESSIVINAPISKVWSVLSDLGEHENFTEITSNFSSSLSPSGEATVGAEWILYMGKDYHKSIVTVVESMKRIETKLIETKWSENMTKWSEIMTLNGGSESTEVSWRVDCAFKGAADLVFSPITKGFLKDVIDKKLEGLKGSVEKR
tara:strand:+ start:466 stop:960 length:495 start_codon:yes stop_codon:yes gene_type:complete